MFGKSAYIALCQQALATVLVGAVGVAAASSSTLDIAGSPAVASPPTVAAPLPSLDLSRVLAISVAPLVPAFGDGTGR